MKPISVQLYSLRDEAAKDFKAVVRRVAEIGYKGVEPAGFLPTPNHFAMMLHLCAGRFSDREEALRTLEESPVLAIPGGAATACLDELLQHGLVVDGKLSDRGRSLLQDSPYAVYAEAMEVNQQ